MRLERFTEAEGTLIRQHVQCVRQNLKEYPSSTATKADSRYLDSVLLVDYAPESAWYTLLNYMRAQRKDGLLPGYLRGDTPSLADYGHLHGTQSLAACAVKLIERLHPKRQDVEAVYHSLRRYDQWLMEHRSHSETGLVEVFCSQDFGTADLPSAKEGGIPPCCPGQDAATMPELSCLPILSVTQSALLYAQRTALVAIADHLGLTQESRSWRRSAQQLRQSIWQHLYDPRSDFFYDRGPQGMRKYRTDHILLLLQNHVLTQEQFDSLYERHFTIPAAGFLPDYPMPTMAVDDPSADDAIPGQGWIPASSALSALYTLSWMDFYNRSDHQTALLSIWLKAFVDNKFSFTDSINPFNGQPIGNVTDSIPAQLLFLEAALRLHLN